MNAIRWGLKTKNIELYQKIVALIRMRKEHKAFRLLDNRSVNNSIRFLDTPTDGVIMYTLDMEYFATKENESWSKCLIVFNGTREPQTVKIPGVWQPVSMGKAEANKVAVKGILVKSNESMILALPFPIPIHIKNWSKE